jgi:hypothetical protein
MGTATLTKWDGGVVCIITLSRELISLTPLSIPLYWHDTVNPSLDQSLLKRKIQLMIDWQCHISIVRYIALLFLESSRHVDYVCNSRQ